jgi:hypothetical protein
MQRWLLLAAALLTFGAVLAGGSVLLQPPRPLILAAAFDQNEITPNADGATDVTRFSYALSRTVQVSLVFERDGQTYSFRTDELRTDGDYTVLFSGIVNGWADAAVDGTIERRLLPDGEYTWRLTAVVPDAQGGATVRDERTGTFTIRDGDGTLPLLRDFSASPSVFSPNQDGVADRTRISVNLSKPAALSVYLLSADGQTIPISARVEARMEGEAGLQAFDYDGGIDLGMDPPPDGVYTLYATAQDAVGQRIVQTTTLTIELGGDPQAEIAAQASGPTVAFTTLPYDARYFADATTTGQRLTQPSLDLSLDLTAVTMNAGDMFVFQLTVENYGDVPLRTDGPRPGTVYQQSQRRAAFGVYDQSGAWVVGIDCDTAASDYPWRWALATDDLLQTVTDPENGNIYYYLPPRTRSVVWGAIRMTDVIAARNPQNCWAGLIHEDVEVRNARVGTREVELLVP